ncbi:cation transporting ATPase C-terminal domain-containing protein [Pseudomonas sp. LjRoot277]|uniref:cation transporting ATPase C-terminal domain-containing protein n=1 Tax=Pseudomonas sp. LjRoot277 TaxID=3342307 RepID=UPI003ECD304D
MAVGRNRAGIGLADCRLQIAVVHWSPLNKAFDTSALTLSQWGLCLAMASAVFWFSELRKLGMRLHQGKAVLHQKRRIF